MITRKIAQYLRQELAADKDKSDAKARQDVIDYFEKSDGICKGISTLWSYSRLIADDDLTDKTKPTDDIEFFKRVYNTLINWDEKRSLAAQEKQDIKIFIYNVMLYQRADVELWVAKKTDSHVFYGVTSSQHKLEEILEDTKRGKPQVIIEQEEHVLTKEMLKKRLQAIIQPKAMISIGSNIYQADKKERLRDKFSNITGHAVSIYQSDKDRSIHYFDINGINNSENFETIVKDIDELVDQIWLSTHFEKFLKPMERIPFSEFRSQNIRCLVFNVHQFPIHIGNQPIPSKAAIDQIFQATETEALDLVLNNESFILDIKQNTRTRMFIRKLDDITVIKILNHDKISENVKAAITYSILDDDFRDNSLLLNKFLSTRISESYFQQAMKEFDIDESKIESLQNKAASSYYIECADSRATSKWADWPEYAKAWLELYDNALLDDKDISSLSLADAFYILEFRLDNPEFINKILLGCNREINKDEMRGISLCLSSAANTNTKSGNIEGVKKLLEICGKELGLFLTLDALSKLKNANIVEFINETFPNCHVYAHVMHRQSYLPSLIDSIKRQEDLPYRIREAFKKDDLSLLKELLKEGDIHDLNTYEFEGYTLAWAAAVFGCLNIIPYLAEIGVRFDIIIKNVANPLRSLLESEPFSGDDNKFRDKDKCINAVKAMLASGADSLVALFPDCLHWVANTDLPELVPLLINAGADINHSEYKGAPPLWSAATAASPLGYPPSPCKPAVYEKMIAEGADIEQALVYAKRIIAEGHGEYYKHPIELLQSSLRQSKHSNYQPNLFKSQQLESLRSETGRTVDIDVIKIIINDSAYWKSKRAGGVLLPDGIKKLQKVLDKNDANFEQQGLNQLKLDLAQVANDQLSKSDTKRRRAETNELYQLLHCLPKNDKQTDASTYYQSIVKDWEDFNKTRQKKLY